MSYIIHYDIAALIVTLVVACHFAVKQSIPSRQTTMFAWMLGLAALANAFDLVTIYTIEHPTAVPVWLNSLLNQLYLITFNGIAAFYYTYLVSWSKNMNEWTTRHYIRTLLPYGFAALLILSTPFTDWIFYFDEGGIYHRGTWQFLLYLEAIYYMIAAIIQVIVHRATMSRTQKVIVIVFTSSAFFAILVQLIVPNLMIVHLAIAISAVLMYLTLQNPENYYNQQFGIFNRMAFHEMFNTHIQRKQSFYILGIQVDGLSFINETHGVGAGNMLLQQVTEFLQQIGGTNHVFHLSGTKFLIMEPCKDTEHQKTVISIIQNRFKNAFWINGIKCTPGVSLCLLECNNNNVSLEDALDMITYSLQEAAGLSDSSVVYATEEILENGRKESRLLQLMKKALYEQKFEVYYQHIYSVKDNCYTM
ncbi:MAG: diguanylate cyclase, partial [Agathobacter sp.]|nr:diguanylate cyclase [Agathobacter sp.]